jgi:diguanylate cyclase (GGDEF)-like protein/PAS domain S-box-containing protein
MTRERRWLSRLTTGAFSRLFSALVISSLCYALGLLLLFPYFDMGARTISFLFVWYWGWRSGVRGGLIAGFLVDVALGDAVSWFAQLPASHYDRIWLYIINNCLIGAFAGGMSELSARLKSELGERNRVETRLRESEECYRLLFNSNPHAMWVCDRETLRFLAVNTAAVMHYGYSAEEFSEMNMYRLSAPDDADDATFTLSRSRSKVTRRKDLKHVRKDGSCLDVEVTGHNVTFQGQPARLYLSTDISDRKRAQAALEHQALHDALTGLPNRVLLNQHLDQIIASSTRTLKPFSLLVLDLDRFKEINDSLGHHYGDRVLQEITKRFLNVLHGSDVLARFGGDEFALLLPDTNQAGALHASRRLQAALESTFVLDGLNIDVGVSVGIAVYPEHGTTPNTLLQHGDVAMYGAKRSRSEVMVYTSDRNEFSPRRLAMASELRQGIECEQLLLHYQPQIDLRTGRVFGAEALVRWPHPRDGMLPPAQFVPLAEHTGLIKSLSLWVLETALLQCRLWRRSGLNIDVAVNLSPTSLKDDQLPKTIERLLNNADALPSWLVLEITENALMTDPAAAKTTLLRLRDMGVRISIDDFGAGQSSLSYLRDYPVDEIKIDRSFIQGINTDQSAATIVQSIIELGANLDFRVVAEGIEDQKTLDRLVALGCHAAQGFFLGRPLPAHEFTSWLNNHNSDRSRSSHDEPVRRPVRHKPQPDPA